MGKRWKQNISLNKMMKRKTIAQENITPPLDELGEIRGMSISKTTTAKSCKKPKEKKTINFWV